MKGRTTCPKCGHSFILDAPKHVAKYVVTCPKCDHKFNINPSTKPKKTSEESEDYYWEECGEPRKTILSTLKEKTNKPMIAGILLAIVFVLGVLWSGVFAFGEDILKSSMQQVSIGGMSGGLIGNITNENNVTISGVNITVSDTNISTISDQNGSYSLENIPVGIQKLNLTKEGYTTQIYETIVSPFQIMSFDMNMSSGDEYPANIHSIDEMWNNLRSSFYVCSVLFIAFSIFALLGGIYALKRKRFGIAVIGSIFGILSFGFIFGSICSFIALILLIVSKEEFENGESKEF